MVSAAVLTNLVLASAGLAAPSLEARLNGRTAAHQSNTTQHLEAPVNIVRDVYTDNLRAGAMYTMTPGTFTAVSGVFVIPIIPPALSASIAITVGIDTTTCTGSNFQTGIQLAVMNGEVLYHPWCKWYPDSTQYLFDSDGNDVNFSPGHVVRLSVTSSSYNTGTAYIQNLSTGKFVYKDIESSSALCGQAALWNVEVMPGSSPLDFTNFGTVIIGDAQATTHTDQIGPGHADTVEITRNGQAMTSTSVDSSSIVIHYN